MSKFIIEGGHKLSGEIETNSAKNSAIAILCACAMIPGRTTLDKVPRIEEVNRIIEVLESIGIRVKWLSKNELEVFNPGKISLNKINKGSFGKTRAALMLMGSLCSFFGEFSLPNPSGCKLGKRTVNPHFIAFEHLGFKVRETEKEYQISRQKSKEKIKEVEFVMYESSDTGTENAVMAAVLKKGVRTTIHFASPNYMVQDLCYFLEQAGAKIKGIGTSTLEITGVEKLNAVKDYPIMPDPIESMAFISVAITTGSKMKIKKCPWDFLKLELEKLRVMGQKFKITKKYISRNGKFKLVDIEIIPSKLRALPDKIYGRPYPGLNTDNLPIFIPILARAEGETLVHDWPYENRAIYAIDMNKLGANIVLMDPHRVIVKGPTEFVANEVICPPALRPSVNLLIAMLAAPGKSVLRNVYSIDRGYENIERRLRKLGAKIKRVKD